MTFGGWLTFILSAGSVTVLFGWCLWRVITSKRGVEDESSEGIDIYEIQNIPKKRK